MTTPDETRHLFEITDRQHSAIDVIVSGKSLGSAAEAAGVTRQTVSSWVNHHPGFQAVLNVRRREILDQRADANATQTAWPSTE